MDTHIKLKSAIASVILTSTFGLNGCATMALHDKADETSINTTYDTLLTDKITAIGLPNQPIEGHEHAMVLAGEKNSYLLQPNIDKNTHADLFAQIYQKVDLSHLFIDTSYSYNSNAEELLKRQENNMKIVLDSEDIANQQLTDWLTLVFIKPKSEVSDTEQTQLEEMKFSCQQEQVHKSEYLVCQQTVKINMTVASKVQNYDSLEHKFKQPMNISVENQTTHEYSNEALKLLTPVSVALDIVALPIYGVVLGIFIVDPPCLIC